jgi:Sulfate permease and related transporters (MFS superfamily)
MYSEFISSLKKEFSGYSRKKFIKDLVAGLTVTAVALPLALAFAISSGVDAASGLIAAIVSSIVIGALSGGYYQISGPTGTMTVILMSTMARYGMTGIFILTFIAGAVRLLCGIFKLGALVNIIPDPVIVGFTSGISIIIAFGQINNLFGVTSEGVTVIDKLISYTELGFNINFISLICGILIIFFMIFYPKKWNAVVPAPLVAIIIATTAVIVSGINVEQVGNMPTTLLPKQRLYFADFNIQMVKNLILPAISVAVLAMIETLLCGASVGKKTGVPLLNNQELIAQGIGNMVIPFFGGIPSTAALARSSFAINSDAQTRLTGIISGVVMVICMLFLSGFMSQIPLSALAGVLLVTAWNMNDWKEIKYLFSHKLMSGIIKFLATMIITVIWDLNTAIFAGIVIGCIVFIAKSTTVEIDIEEINLKKIGIEKSKNAEKWRIIYISGPLFFMNAYKLKSELTKVDDKNLILSMRGVPLVDITAINIFLDLYNLKKDNGRELIFSSMNKSVVKVFKQSGINEHLADEVMVQSVDKFLRGIL